MRRWMAGVLSGVMLAGALTLEAGAVPVPDTQNPGQSGQEQETVGLFLDVPEDAYYAPWVRWPWSGEWPAAPVRGCFLRMPSVPPPR